MTNMIMVLRYCMILLLATPASSTYFDFSLGFSLVQVGDDITGSSKPLYVVPSATLCDNAGFYNELAKNTGGMILVDNELTKIDTCTCVQEGKEPPTSEAPTPEVPTSEAPTPEAAVDLTSEDINNFLGLTGGTALSFVFDTTGSMGGHIEKCKDVAKYIATKRDEARDPVATYVLTEFNDPSVGPSTVYNNYDEFINAVNAVSAHGDGDCPGSAMRGVMQAIMNTPAGSPIFIFTDAPPNDPEESGLVQMFAEWDNKPLYFVILSGLCGCDAGLYAELATATGGMVLEYTDEGTNLTELMTDLIRAVVSADSEGDVA